MDLQMKNQRVERTGEKRRRPLGLKKKAAT